MVEAERLTVQQSPALILARFPVKRRLSRSPLGRHATASPLALRAWRRRDVTCAESEDGAKAKSTTSLRGEAAYDAARLYTSGMRCSAYKGRVSDRRVASVLYAVNNEPYEEPKDACSRHTPTLSDIPRALSSFRCF
ncbi:hypothetical protein MTO96_006250 [Rhipicephalus appendiculatus]